MGSVLTSGSSKRHHRSPESQANELIGRLGYLSQRAQNLRQYKKQRTCVLLALS